MADPEGCNPLQHGDPYRRLIEDEIKLFTVLPKQDAVCHQELQLIVRISSLQDAGSYTAISYTWLDEIFSLTAQARRPDVTVTCNGLPNTYATRLWPLILRLYEDGPKAEEPKRGPSALCDGPASCNEPLYKSDSVWYWLDAICINQGDKDERGLQVAMMGEIYAKAALVNTFLGADWSISPDPTHTEDSQLRSFVWSHVY